MAWIQNGLLRLMAWREAAKMRLQDEEGQTLVEYALIIALVSIALVAALGALAGGIDGVFDKIVTTFGGDPGNPGPDS